MTKKAMQNQGFSFMGLTSHELDVILAYRKKLETHKSVDTLLNIESDRSIKRVSTDVVGLGYDINILEGCYDELCKMQCQVEKWNPEIGRYIKKQIDKLGNDVNSLRVNYNRLYEEE